MLTWGLLLACSPSARLVTCLGQGAEGRALPCTPVLGLEGALLVKSRCRQRVPGFLLYSQGGRHCLETLIKPQTSREGGSHLPTSMSLPCWAGWGLGAQPPGHHLCCS